MATDVRELGETEREIADILGQRTTYAVPTCARRADMRRSNKRVIDDLYGEKEDPGGEGARSLNRSLGQVSRARV